MSDPRYDLHTHSTASDGTQPPSEVVRSAQRAGLDGIALTDHDTTAGWAEAMHTARETGTLLVPGMEFTCRTHEGSASTCWPTCPTPTMRRWWPRRAGRGRHAWNGRS